MAEILTYRNRNLQSVSRITLLLIGVLLLSAASLKFFGLASGKVGNESVLRTQWIQVLAIEVEVLLSLWLFSGWKEKYSWKVCVLCFSLFALVNLIEAVQGHLSCACFGSVIDVHPWTLFIFDVGVVLLLTTIKAIESSSNAEQARTLTQMLRCNLSLLLLLLPLVLSVVSVFVFRTSIVAFFKGEMLLTVEPERINFNELYQSGMISSSFRVRNNTNQLVVINTIETSCPCLQVQLPKYQLEKGEMLTGVLVLNMGIEPHFTGALLIEAAGKNADGQKVLRISLSGTVVPTVQN